MRTFDYKQFTRTTWASDILSYVGQIHEHKGRQEFYLNRNAAELQRLIEIAKIQSVDSSNAIEGILTTNTRINELMNKKTTPRNRDESEILGYRDVLNTIHENYEYIPLRVNYILQLHRDLYRYSYSSVGGKLKGVQNYINIKTAAGSEYVLFTPLAPYETPDALENICSNYERALDACWLDELLLIPIFISDFLCIHPFADGNGRMSRLLTTLMLYRSGYQIGRYISLEKIIAETKQSYYDALRGISRGWHEGGNDYYPFIRYFLQILMRAYKDLDERLRLTSDAKPTTVI